ncbi:hypothetical protein VN23_08185 [Janthinobacterium sp. B9-8]|nr:hypothetical protein VN23_08185 [Janthinobacterium sp. B9-8]
MFRTGESSKTFFQCLRHVDLGAGVPLDLPFLRGQETKPKKAAPQTRNPFAADNRAAAAELASLRQSSPKPRPLVPRSARFQGRVKAPCEECKYYVFFIVYLCKKNDLHKNLT